MARKRRRSFVISTYVDDGRVFYYRVGSESTAREHSAAIARAGYRHNDGTVFEHYPAHRILKVKVTPAPRTLFRDKVRGT